MSFVQLLRALKGGAGSGNWGHSGRPGKIGGSNKGGGHRRIGGKPEIINTADSKHEALRTLASAFQQRRNEVRPLIEKVAAELGYDPSLVEYGGEPYSFKVGDANYEAGMSHSPDGRIKVYKGAAEYATKYPDLFRGMMAHEIQHEHWNQFMRQADAENKAMSDRLMAESKAGVHYSKSFLKPDGSFRNPEDAKSFKAQSFRSNMAQDWDKLAKADGVTDYSTSYWKKFKKSKTTDDFYRAVNETLAEVANLKSQDMWHKVKSPWKTMYNVVSQYGKS